MHLHEVGERSLFWEISFHLPWIEGYPFYHPSSDNHWKLRLKQQWMKSQRNLQRESTMLGSDWLTDSTDTTEFLQSSWYSKRMRFNCRIKYLGYIRFVLSEPNRTKIFTICTKNIYWPPGPWSGLRDLASLTECSAPPWPQICCPQSRAVLRDRKETL